MKKYIKDQNSSNYYLLTDDKIEGLKLSKFEYVEDLEILAKLDGIVKEYQVLQAKNKNQSFFQISESKESWIQVRYHSERDILKILIIERDKHVRDRRRGY
ncbi:hypothetical protein GCQ56_07755 [Marinifilum sp. N1E240]|uniref:hypothetical protein n=1 Tax=Marinifilum sp. N1E240 TaxID=2608082 RepID=UPI00128B79E1|nr:hypothetical protein [Marinifilum sp. N1E240]MPQ46908.1 hypothetical protein [Marinifilum sp. N1E240]